MVATFDTAFYADLPEEARLYALPRELSERLGIRRYGFHGLAHRYMVTRFRALRPEVGQPRLVTLQLGNGCSATASADGRPLDTSMGFTPLEGLIMGTRSGDLDPALPLFLAESEKLTPAEVDSLLNTRSGLLGLSGISHDMRDLLAASRRGEASAELAIAAFCLRVRKYVGAYLSVLGGADAIVFGGGIGEHSPEIRARICGGMEWAGLRLNLGANDAALGGEERISTDASPVEAWVLSVNEAAIIAEDVYTCLHRSSSPS
jgi:acetate kinase